MQILDKGYPSVSFNSWKIGSSNVGGNHKTNVRAMARDGIVLLKNNNSSLPLNKPKSIAIVGLDSIVAPKGANACTDRGCDDGTLAMGWGSGSVEFPYLIAPLDAIKTKAQSDGTTITSSPNDNASQGANVAKGADVAIVCINADAGEGYITVEGNAGDRKDLNAWHNGNGTFKCIPEALHAAPTHPMLLRGAPGTLTSSDHSLIVYPLRSGQASRSREQEDHCRGTLRRSDSHGGLDRQSQRCRRRLGWSAWSRVWQRPC
jgi:hypothetical protein